MTNKEKATALMAVMGDETRAWTERLAAQVELNALKKAAKVGWEKLGVTQKWLDWFEDSHARQHDALPDTASLSQPTPQPDDGFQMSEEELAKQTMRPKPDPEEALEQPALKEEVVAAVAEGLDVPKAKAEAVVERGLISAMVRKLLLETDLPYSAIVERVRAQHPTAKTSARSVASTAADMRKAKQPVKERRVPAAAK